MRTARLRPADPSPSRLGRRADRRTDRGPDAVRTGAAPRVAGGHQPEAAEAAGRRRARAGPAGFRTVAGTGRRRGRRGAQLVAVVRDHLSSPAIAPRPAVPRDAGNEVHEADETRRWADYSYAHGGKDGTPFPVDRDTYDRNIAILTDAVRRARLGENDKFHALKRFRT
jgi:hypothetical protein